MTATRQIDVKADHHTDPDRTSLTVPYAPRLRKAAVGYDQDSQFSNSTYEGSAMIRRQTMVRIAGRTESSPISK
jgi:hypothetical protein